MNKSQQSVDLFSGQRKYSSQNYRLYTRRLSPRPQHLFVHTQPSTLLSPQPLCSSSVGIPDNRRDSHFILLAAARLGAEEQDLDLIIEHQHKGTTCNNQGSVSTYWPLTLPSSDYKFIFCSSLAWLATANMDLQSKCSSITHSQLRATLD